MLVVMDKSTPEEHLIHSLQINIEQFKIAVTFLTGYNGIHNMTNKIKKLYFTVSMNGDDFNQRTIPPGEYKIKSLKNEIRRNNIEEDYFTEANYPFTIKPNF